MTRPTKDEQIKYNVYYPQDTDYSAFARLLQSKWRDRKGFPELNLGNFLEIEFAKTTKANYLTEDIKQLVTDTVVAAKKNGAVISEPRIWNNLLSSQPLCFNLFGELHYDLELATKYFKQLFPTRIDTVTSVKFEYSVGRGNKEYTGDHSAFDIFVEYLKDNKKGFIGIEVKYSESLKEETKEKANETFLKHEKEYRHLTTEKIFKANAIEIVNQIPLSQIWRDHLLSIAHLKDYDEGFFVFLFPKANIHCQNGVNEYLEQLISDNEELTGFYPRYLEDFIKTLRNIHKTEWTKELEERYLGIEQKMETKYFFLAHKLNKEYKQLLAENQVHFRGSLNSISLISVSEEKPELGTKCNFFNYNCGSDIRDLIIADIQKFKSAPGRPTPEKELQSWIINYALKNDYQLPFDENIKFISSEIAIKNNANKKIVTDILGYNETNKQLYVIELKCARDETRLIEQVNNFENIINEKTNFFSELLSIHGFISPNGISNSIAKLVVWPHENTSPKQKLKAENIFKITFQKNYTLSPNKYTFCKF